MSKVHVVLGCLIFLSVWVPTAGGAAAGLQLDLVHASGARDTRLEPSVQLHVEAGQAPSTFLPEGPFRASWEGFIAVDLRSDMLFRVESRGRFSLWINGEDVLEHEGGSGPSDVSDYILLNKGTNSFRATLVSLESGAAQVRLFWGEDEYLLTPVPEAAFSHEGEPPELQFGETRRRGLVLAMEHRCFHCHTVSAPAVQPELAMDAPSLMGIGGRRRSAWLEAWILDPSAHRSDARMPRILTLRDGPAEARAMAAYLASLTNAMARPAPKPSPTRLALGHLPESKSPQFELEARLPLFERFQCVACHQRPGERPAGPEEEAKLSLQHVAAKFPEGRLAEFLMHPEADYEWTRMPNLHLNEEEAGSLARFLMERADPAEEDSTPPVVDRTLRERGRELVQGRGCLNCHELELPNSYQAPAWKDLSQWDAGCLARQPAPDSKAAHFAFTEVDRQALRTFARGAGAAALSRSAPAEFARRQLEQLQCGNCHEKLGPSFDLELLGQKLRPEWTERLMAGQLPYKPRPWMPARMPAFASRAQDLAIGLAQAHGHSPETPAEPPSDPGLVDLGRQLVGKEGGFSCVACHALGGEKATDVFEVEGINFSQVAARLQRDFYRRWLLSPSSIDPQTKMPAYFEEGTSPLYEILEGDADAQLGAIWEFLRLGDGVSPSETESR